VSRGAVLALGVGVLFLFARCGGGDDHTPGASSAATTNQSTSVVLDDGGSHLTPEARAFERFLADHPKPSSAAGYRRLLEQFCQQRHPHCHTFRAGLADRLPGSTLPTTTYFGEDEKPRH